MHEPAEMRPSPSMSKEDNRGKVRALRIQPAENGYTLSVSFDPKKQQGPYPSDEDFVYENPAGLLAHVKALLNGKH